MFDSCKTRSRVLSSLGSLRGPVTTHIAVHHGIDPRGAWAGMEQAASATTSNTPRLLKNVSPSSGVNTVKAAPQDAQREF